MFLMPLTGTIEKSTLSSSRPTWPGWTRRVSPAAWIELSGELVEYHLAAGETLRVHPGHVGLLDESVDFSIVPVKGIKNMVFGADSIFLAALTGPGTVWLQSLPLPNLAHALKPYLEGRDQNQTNKSAGFLSMLES
jgi:hypothetical protein